MTSVDISLVVIFCRTSLIGVVKTLVIAVQVVTNKAASFNAHAGPDGQELYAMYLWCHVQ